MQVQISLLFQGHVSPDNPFQVAILGPDEKRAILIQRLRPSLHGAFTDTDRDVMANGRTTFFPFVSYLFELAGADSSVIEVKLAQNGRSQFRSIDRLSTFDLE